MLTFLSERKLVTVGEEKLNFYLVETDEVHYGFPVLDGKITPAKNDGGKLVPCPEEECPWWENYQRVVADPAYYGRREVEEFTYMEDAKVRCDCGGEFHLYDQFYGSCECPKCGQWYNLFGQEVCGPEEQMRLEDW